MIRTSSSYAIKETLHIFNINRIKPALVEFYRSQQQLKWLRVLAQYEVTFPGLYALKPTVTHVSRSYFHVSSHTQFKTSCLFKALL